MKLLKNKAPHVIAKMCRKNIFPHVIANPMLINYESITMAEEY
jgi:hypothetical protein